VQQEGERLSLAQIDNVLCKGDLEAFTRLLELLIREPNGATAHQAERLIISRNLDDPEFFEKDAFYAVHYLLKALRHFPPHVGGMLSS